MQLTYYNNWNKDNYKNFFKELAKFGDSNYLEFNKKIIFTKYQMLGIRIPDIRKVTKIISKSNFREFLNCKFSGLYEELLIRGILLSYIDDYKEFINYLDQFIVFIDNWAICDTCLSSYKIVNKNKDVFFVKIKEYLNSCEEFIVRVGVIFLLDYFLVDEYIDEVLELINNIKLRAYYVDMAIAWLISVSFVKYQDKTIEFLDNNKLDKEIIRMAIQKIRDSLRIDKTVKDFVLKYK